MFNSTQQSYVRKYPVIVLPREQLSYRLTLVERLSKSKRTVPFEKLTKDDRTVKHDWGLPKQFNYSGKVKEGSS